jgi:hypothetical protein
MFFWFLFVKRECCPMKVNEKGKCTSVNTCMYRYMYMIMNHKHTCTCISHRPIYMEVTQCAVHVNLPKGKHIYVYQNSMHTTSNIHSYTLLLADTNCQHQLKVVMCSCTQRNNWNKIHVSPNTTHFHNSTPGYYFYTHKCNITCTCTHVQYGRSECRLNVIHTERPQTHLLMPQMPGNTTPIVTQVPV